MSCQRQRLRIATAICAVGLCSTSAQSREPSGAYPPASTVAAEVVDRTNVERTHHKRAPLRANSRLMRAAQMHAEQMARACQLARVFAGPLS
jgi:uncharacterized protein YkwD